MSEDGAKATAAAIAAGRTTARAACEAAIARIEAADGAINAVVVRDFDRARDAADAADARRADGASLPLLGVPMTVKESYDVAGLPTTWGFAEHADHLATADATVVQRLKAAGAVILGKTNVPVALADWQSVNPVYGRTDNPRAPGRSAGGSSGGSAAALAAGMVPLEYGSDIGGSIRVPAHFCGVWGHKPTWGLMPLEGHYFPRTEAYRTVMSVGGPLARDADDLLLALELTADVPLARPRVATLRGARILVLAEQPGVPVDAEVAAALEHAAQAASDAGAILTRTGPLPDLAQMMQDYLRLLLVAIARGVPRPDTGAVTLPEWFDMLDTQTRTQRAWARLFGEVDAVLAPVAGIAAFPHDDVGMGERAAQVDGVDTPFGLQLAWAGLANYTELPATAFPAGATADGRPIGLQLIGPRWGDRQAIALARALQAAIGDTPMRAG